MFNPQFLKELLSSPTFLLMLFHAVEVAYTSMPIKSFWLKPLVKLVAQPSFEKEEEIWWRRKRIYDVLNGHGSSELQLNMKTIHFRNPGSPAPIALPTLTKLIRHLDKKPAPNPAHYKQPIDKPSTKLPPFSHNLAHNHAPKHYQSFGLFPEQQKHQIRPQTQVEDAEAEVSGTNSVENDLPNWQMLNSNMIEQHSGSEVSQKPPSPPVSADQQTFAGLIGQEDWLSQIPSPEELMSKQDFDALEPKKREILLDEARKRLEESTWTNEIIKQHSDFIDSFTSQNYQQQLGESTTQRETSIPNHRYP